jgi:hypothetical protein
MAHVFATQCILVGLSPEIHPNRQLTAFAERADGLGLRSEAWIRPTRDAHE